MSEVTQSTDVSARAGFRLERLELWNWGTFHGGIQTLDVGGGWGLIVGDNGSGKSTAIDAVRTLLVPPRILNYNDAAGDGRRAGARDRSRRSYVRGAWASSSVVDSAAVTTQYLREPGALSAIAAVFSDVSRSRSVTLAQVLWEYDEQVSEIYAIVSGCRSLRELVEGRSNSGEIRRAARRSGWDVDDTFTAYAERMRGMLHIPGEKALEVFNRAIGMKEVGDIDAFVRQFMLPAAETYGFIRETLLPHYRTLLDCWVAITRAERQVALLTPVREYSQRITEGEVRTSDCRRLQDLIAPFTAALHIELLRAHIAELETAYRAGEVEYAETKRRLDSVRAERDELLIAKANNDVGARLTTIENELRHAEEQRRRAEERRAKLASAIVALDAKPALMDAAAFTSARGGWEERQAQSHRQALEHDERRAALLQERSVALGIAAAKRQELESVERNRINIPYNFLTVRARVAQAVGVDARVLPFAGELMEVRDDYADWTGAIERLLRGFALSLLVPDTHYRAAATYINATFLGLRLTFHRVPTRPVTAPSLSPDRVPGRLRFRVDHALHLWVAAELVRSFNHRCCAAISELEQVDFGLTREGLVKNGARHVKDDGRRVDDASDRVLGWSVEQKIAALKRHIKECEENAAQIGAAADAALRAAEDARRIAAAARDLLNVVDFAEINPAQWSADIIRLNRAHAELAGSSAELAAIQTRLDQLDVDIKLLDDQLRASDRLLGGIRQEIEKNDQQVRSREGEMLAFPDYDHAASLRAFEEDFADLPAPTVGNCVELSGKIDKKLQGRINREQGRIGDARTKMVAHMSDFLNEFAEYKQLLRPEPAYADGFVAALDRIEREELPQHRERFEQYLSENLVGTLVMLQHRLDQHQEDIEDRIREINEALRGIDYTDETYVELRLVPKPAQEVSDFKRALKECFEHGITPSREDHLLIFDRVRTLLEGFERDPDRTQRVVDVRTWLAAGIRERRRRDEEEVNFYAATTGKSGGQKAKLAFTILASALCAQYGLSPAAPDAPQFRLVVIDEAFSRTDETNSTRAMHLFARLGFQVLIVGPFDAKAKLAVPFVESIHLVTNPSGDGSQVHVLSRAEVEREVGAVTAPDDALAIETHTVHERTVA